MEKTVALSFLRAQCDALLAKHGSPLPVSENAKHAQTIEAIYQTAEGLPQAFFDRFGSSATGRDLFREAHAAWWDAA